MQVGDGEATVRDEPDPHAGDRHPLKKYKMTKQMVGGASAGVLGLEPAGLLGQQALKYP